VNFDAHAAEYDAHAGVQRAVAARCADWLEPSGSGLEALELGAGTGLFTEHLASRGFARLTATDLSPKMLEVGARRVPTAAWQLLDAWDPLGQPVDRLYSVSLLQWSPEPSLTLRRWRGLLQRGGRALVGLFVQGSLGEFETILPGFAAFRWRLPEEWLALAQGAGLRLERADCWEQRVHYPRALDALRALHRTGAVVSRATSPSDLRRALRTYDARFGGAAGVPVTWCALRAELTAA
jgi:malonyl-CoA O-methyltransferase